ncbi:MAG: NADH-quinone oxidoreductase subunit A [Ginsengibacter sp.]|jgi:NADH-quinone oxidoreductase subunit A
MHHSVTITLFWPFLVYAIAVVLLVSGMLLLSHFLGQRHSEHATDEPYESGILETGSARVRFSLNFYIVALLFVIFDIEAIFIIAWGIAVKELGWPGYIAILIFIGVLVSLLIYEWRIGALDFGPDTKRILKAYRKQKEK